MDAAQELFLKNGFTTTNIDQVVKQAGVAKGTFYTYFSSKEEIVKALRERYIIELRARVLAVIGTAESEDRRLQLQAWVERVVSGFLRKARIHDLLFHEIGSLDRQKKQDNPLIADLAIFLQCGEREGKWHIDDARLTATMLFNAMHGAVDDALAGRIERERLVPLIQDHFEKALGL